MKTLKDRFVRPINLDLAEIVFLGMATIGNLQYISYLSRQRLSPHDRMVRLTSETLRIRLSIDDVGIRNIEFLSHSKSFPDYPMSPSASNFWYKTLQPQEHRTISRIQGFSDDHLLRDVDIGQEPLLDPAFKAVIEWNVPQAPDIDAKHCYRTSRPNRTRGPERMRWIPLRRGIRGIVAALGSCGVLTLHAWDDSSDSNRTYDTHPYIREDTQWVFFPIEAEEYLSEVWVRQAPDITDTSSAIFVLTARGRSYTIGEYIVPLRQWHYDFLPLFRDGNGVVSGLCVNALDSQHHAIGSIGLDFDPAPKQDPMRMTPRHPLLPGCPRWAPNDDWYVSCASLLNITKVQRCRDTSHPNQPYIGLLIHYQDQSREAVGQWRWDLSIDCVSFDDCNPAYVQYRIARDIASTLVTDIEFTPAKLTQGTVLRAHPCYT